MKSRVLLSFVVVQLATPCFAGVYLTATMRVEAPGRPPGAAGMGDSKTKTWASGQNSKTEFVEGQNPMTPPGSYMIVKDGGKTQYIVSPNEKTYSQFDPQALGGGSMGALKGITNMKFEDLKAETLIEEDGPAIAGLPTRHYRFRRSYTMTMQLVGTHKTKTSTDEDIWAAPKVTDVSLRPSQEMKTGFDDLDKQIQAELSKARGLPMKRVAVTTSTDDSGKTTTSKMTMEVTEFQSVEVPDSTFEIPSGYRQTQLDLGNVFKAMMQKQMQKKAQEGK